MFNTIIRKFYLFKSYSAVKKKKKKKTIAVESVELFPFNQLSDV